MATGAILCSYDHLQINSLNYQGRMFADFCTSLIDRNIQMLIILYQILIYDLFHYGTSLTWQYQLQKPISETQIIAI